MFHGTLTALITPFKPAVGAEPEIDFDALTDLVEWQLSCGINGFVVLGTTGESATLSHHEKIAVFKHVVQITKKRVPLIAGTGTNCTQSSIELTREAKELGYDGALVVAPYYNKPTQEGLYQHFCAVAHYGGLPVVIYNIPGRTSIDISAETFGRLSKHSEFVGVKEASGSSGKLMEIAEAVQGRIHLYAGDCNVTYLVMCAGGRGVISASANVIPKEMLAVTSSFEAGRKDDSFRAQIAALPKIKALFAETNPAPAKAVLAMSGKIESDTLRLPLVTVKQETREMLKRVFAL